MLYASAIIFAAWFTSFIPPRVPVGWKQAFPSDDGWCMRKKGTHSSGTGSNVSGWWDEDGLSLVDHCTMLLCHERELKFVHAHSRELRHRQNISRQRSRKKMRLEWKYVEASSYVHRQLLSSFHCYTIGNPRHSDHSTQGTNSNPPHTYSHTSMADGKAFLEFWTRAWRYCLCVYWCTCYRYIQSKKVVHANALEWDSCILMAVNVG